ncbi:MAG: hypothetical protein R3B41_01490 [Candidatus Doudnabacteria bacterium]
MNIQELLKIAGKQGKTVVVDQAGQVLAVLLSPEHYQKLSKLAEQGNHSRREIKDAIERVNQAIMRAQLEDDFGGADFQNNTLGVSQPQFSNLDVNLTNTKQMPNGQQLEFGPGSKQVIPEQDPLLDPDLETFDNQNNFYRPGFSVGDQTQPDRLGNLITKRAEELFISKPFGRGQAPDFDLRSEVVDPSFGYLGKETQPQAYQPAPTVTQVSDDEEIAPNFDDV